MQIHRFAALARFWTTLVLLVAALGPGLAAAAPAPQAGVTIHVAMIDEPREQWLKQQAERFEQETGIRVVIDLLGFEPLTTKTLTASQAKNYFELPLYASSGWIMDLTDWVQRDAAEVQPDDIHPALQRTHCMVNGRWYGLPMHVNSHAFFYRTDIFQELGLEPPKNWDDVIAAAKLITEKMAPEVYGITFMGAPDVQLGVEVLDIMAAQGSYFYDRSTYQPLMDTPSGVRTMQILQELARYAPPGVAGYALDANYNAFAQGQAAMTIAWTTGVFFFADPAKSKIVDKWAVMPMPGGYTVQGGWSLTISADSKQKEAAWTWIKWATSLERERELLGNMETPRLTLLRDPEVQTKWPNNKVFLEGLDASPVLMPQLSTTIEMFTKAAVHANDMLTGGKSPEEAARAIQQEFVDILTRAGYLKG